MVKRRNSIFFKRLPFFVSVVAVILLIYDLGFGPGRRAEAFINHVYTLTVAVGAVSTVVKYFFKSSRPNLKAIFIDVLLMAFFVSLVVSRLDVLPAPNGFVAFMSNRIPAYVAVLLVFVREFSSLSINLRTHGIRPEQLFIFSFMLIIIIGTFLLLLPNATNGDFSFIDSLFTSTSAVCVTGLVVVDTAAHFTTFGKIIIIILIQIGGLGIMTFASYLTYFFKGSSSYNNYLTMQDIVNTDTMDDVFHMLKRIIFITFLIEFIGAVFIFYSIDDSVTATLGQRIFFAVFHSISGFCNAGFSLLPDGLCNPVVQFNYPLQIIIALLIILGGLGFPIIFNIYKYINVHLYNFLIARIFHRRRINRPRLITINSRIVMVTTIVLLLVGTMFFFVSEYDGILSEHGFGGRIVAAFFCSATARTAGFNAVDFSQMLLPSALFMIFIMWIGASPASTGGGIKTSTFAISMLNIRRLILQKPHLEFGNREISENTVHRSQAIVMLSIMVIGTAVMILSISDGDKGLLQLVFETVSAFATVGLSLGITADLSLVGKIVIIIVMFIGRVNMLTILVAFFRKILPTNYRYPTESILIN